MPVNNLCQNNYIKWAVEKERKQKKKLKILFLPFTMQRLSPFLSSSPKPAQDLTAHKQVHFDGKIMKPRSKVEQREQLLPVKAGEENQK